MFADFSGGGRQTSISMLSRCCFTWWRTTTNLPSSPSSFSLLFFLLRTLETTIFLLVFNCFPALPVTGQPNNFMMFPHPQPTLFLHEGHISMLESLTPIPQFNGGHFNAENMIKIFLKYRKKQQFPLIQSIFQISKLIGSKT
jgi:hypothetical protein